MPENFDLELKGRPLLELQIFNWEYLPIFLRPFFPTSNLETNQIGENNILVDNVSENNIDRKLQIILLEIIFYYPESK